MKRFFVGITLFLVGLMVLLYQMPANAALADVSASIGSDDVYEVNNATPGTSKTFLGTRLRGPLQAGSTTVSSCTSSVTACNSVALTAATAAYVVTTGSAWGMSDILANGYQNQIVTFILGTDGGQDFRVSPSTKTGFTNVQLNDANDSVSLKYINSTVGWIITGNNGAVIN